MDPNRPLDVVVQVESPHVVRYRLFAKKAGDADFALFARGSNKTAGQPHPVGPLGPGAEIGGAFNVGGNARTAYRIRLTCVQNGAPVPGASAVASGVTDEDGADAVDERITLP